MQEGPFKYILATKGGDQFYDLASDPLELDNLIDTSHLEIDRIKRMLFEVKQKKPHVRPVKSDEPNPEDYLEELKALGYVQ